MMSAREVRVLEDLDDVGVFLADLVDLLVLLREHILEVIAVDEVMHAVRGEVPGLGRLDLGQELASSLAVRG
jgi:hypothetical protein